MGINWYGDDRYYNIGYCEKPVDISDSIEKFRFHADIIISEKNAEIRAKMIKGTGLVQFLSQVQAKTIEKKNDYELLNFSFDGQYRPYLKMLNPSTGTWHIEGVHPKCRTINEALHWRNKTKEKPIILT